jgi:protein-disulfide isomerase/type II secretory pathway component PulC
MLAVAAVGCSRKHDAGETPAAPSQSQTVSPSAVVATIGDRALTASEIDAAIAGPLSEIDFQRYLLRRQALESQLLRAITAPDSTTRTARITLEPPLPSAVELRGRPAAMRPDVEVPVTVTVFCDLESPHCAVVQSTLADLRRLYPASVRIAARDLPLPIHPHAQTAAEAARCAGAQGRYWPYHDLLLARGLAPDRTELEAVAAAQGLDATEFGTCLDAHAQEAAVSADAALARDLGLGMVPEIFVNGRRAVAPVGTAQLMWLVELELAAAGQREPTPGNRGTTKLPLALRATIVGATPGLGLAVIGDRGSARSDAVYREGEQPLPGVIVRRVQADQVELLVEDGIEVLALTTAEEGKIAEAGSDDASGQAAEQISPSVLRGPTPMAVFLDREMVRERMTDRVKLSVLLKPVPMTVDGYRLLKLDTVPPGSLYELLGLQPGDVIVAVNERPIHEGDNPLFDALDRESEVRVRVMRRGGIAHQYVYRFQ